MAGIGGGRADGWSGGVGASSVPVGGSGGAGVLVVAVGTVFSAFPVGDGVVVVGEGCHGELDGGESSSECPSGTTLLLPSRVLVLRLNSACEGCSDRWFSVWAVSVLAVSVQPVRTEDVSTGLPEGLLGSLSTAVVLTITVGLNSVGAAVGAI